MIGLGGMGRRIAARLLDAGYEVAVWNRSPDKAKALVDRGATAAESPAEAAAQAGTLITIVADPAALHAVTAGESGTAAGAHASLTMIEMSTVGPAAIYELAAELPEGTPLLDAPVLGSLHEVEEGSLTIYVGGPEAVLGDAIPVLGVLGSPIHVGPLGSGQAAKLVANATLFGTLATLGEAVALARALGLAPETTFEVLATTPLAAQAERRRPAIESGEFSLRFPLALARKDADLIADAAAAAGGELRLLDAARTWLTDAARAGLGAHDYTAVMASILARLDSPGPPAAASRESSDPIPYDALIVDLDGVVWRGGEPIDGASAALARIRADGIRVLFLTNDPARSRAEQADRLAAMQVPASAADVLTSGAAVARYLQTREHFAGNAVLAIGSPAFLGELAEVGFDLLPIADAGRAEIVVVAGHDGFDYAELRAATTAVLNGADLYAAGRDAVFPSRDGPRPATGAILAAIETATGATATVIGKPEPFIFDLAREALGGADRVAVVGDHLVSDVVGARRAGLDAILVLTGTATEADLARAPVKPDLVVASLAALAPS